MLKQKINKLLIGTNNKGKLREIESLLPKNIEIHSTSEFNLKSPIENGKTFKENSLIKSKYFSKKTGLICLADENLDIENKQKTEQEAKEEIKEPTPEEKIAELEDKVTRTFAEMENQRRRFEKEKNDAFEYGGFAFAKEALNLVDNLERSKLILENDEKLKETDALKKTLEHLEIIKKDLISIFIKNNITPIECINKKLDPNLHQAMIEIEDNQKEAGTIVQEIQKGFMIKDRLLRPSLVGVSKKIQKNDEKPQENKENLDK